MSTSSDFDAFENAVRDREVNSEDTLEDYVRWARRFETWHDGSPPVEVDLRMFDQWLAETPMSDFPWSFTRPISNDEDYPGYAYRTRIKALSAVKLWSRMHYDSQISNEVQNIALGDEPNFDPPRISVADCDRIKNAADDACKAPDCAVALSLGYDALMRAAEITRVRTGDIDSSAGVVYVRAVKGSLNADIGLSPDTASMVSDHVADHSGRDRPFYNTYGRPWKPKALAKHFWRKHHSVGIHSFSRHSPICHRLNAGESFGDVYRRARHSQPSTTAQYARLVGAPIPDYADD